MAGLPEGDAMSLWGVVLVGAWVALVMWWRPWVPAPPGARRRASRVAALTRVVPVVALGGVVAGPGGLLAGLVAGVWLATRAGGSTAPRGTHTSRPSASTDAGFDGLAEVADLLGLALGAGFSVPEALGVVARSGLPGPVARWVRDIVDREPTGATLTTRLEAGGRGDPRRSRLIAVLLDRHRLGAPASESLWRLAEQDRLRRRRLAEARVRRLPVLLLFPLVCCLLPALVVVLLPPLAGLLAPFGP